MNVNRVEVYDSVFENNQSGYFGGAIDNYGDGTDGSVQVHNSRFENNFAVTAGAGIRSAGTLTVDQSVFKNNTTSTTNVNTPTYGGAIAAGQIHASPAVTITNSHFEGNTAAYGGAISSTKSIFALSGNTFSNNQGTYGGGVYFDTFYARGTATINSNTFDGNLAYRGSGVMVRNLFNGSLTYNKFVNSDSGAMYSDYHPNAYGDPDGIIQVIPLEAHNNCFDPNGNNFNINGIWNVNQNLPISAENNWWGDASGPSGIGSGTGAYLTGYNINYIPYLNAPTACGATPPTPPTITPLSSSTVSEGDVFAQTGSFSDPDSTSYTATVDYGDGSAIQPLSLNADKTFTLSHVYQDEGTFTVNVSVTDNQGGVGTGAATITVNNMSPAVSLISAPRTPVAANASLTASATFADPGILDTHTATWDWGDGITPGTVTETNGSGNVSDSHTYAQAGVYTITLAVTDNAGASVTSAPFQYIVVYNPTGGFVTASGKYMSLAGWDRQDSQATGEVKFGISAQYLIDSSVPTGQSKLNFKAGDIDFKTTTFQWLVVSGSKAAIAGIGSVNGVDGYSFFFSGIDGGDGQSYVRFQITDPNDGVIYDTQPGAPTTTDPTTPLTSGSVKVH